MSSNFVRIVATASSAINGISTDEFQRLLGTIISNLKSSASQLFAPEEARLCQMFKLSEASLRLVLDSCCFVFEQAAYQGLGADALFQRLVEAGCDEEHARILVGALMGEAGEDEDGGCDLGESFGNGDVYAGDSIEADDDEDDDVDGEEEAGEEEGEGGDMEVVEEGELEKEMGALQTHHLSMEYPSPAGSPDIDASSADEDDAAEATTSRGSGPFKANFGADASAIWGAAAQRRTRRPRGSRSGRRSAARLPPAEAELLGRGQAAFVAGDYDLAVEYMSELVKLAPMLPDPYHTLGLIYEDSGQSMEALQMFALAATNDPRNVDLWSKVMHLSVETCQWSQAMGAINSILRLDETSADALLSRPFVTLELGDEQKAYEQLDAALQRYPGHLDALLQYADLCSEKSLAERSAACHSRYVYNSICGTVQLPDDILAIHHCSYVVNQNVTDVAIATVEDVFYACSCACSCLLGLFDSTLVINFTPGDFDPFAHLLHDPSTLEAARRLVSSSVDFAHKTRNESEGSHDAFIPLDIAMTSFYIDLVIAVRDGGDNDRSSSIHKIVRKLVDLLDTSRTRLLELIGGTERAPIDSDIVPKRRSEACLLCCLATRVVAAFARLGLASLSVKYVDAVANLLAADNHNVISATDASIILLELASIQQKLHFPLDAVAKVISASISCCPENICALIYYNRLYDLEPSGIADPTSLYAAHYIGIASEINAKIVLGGQRGLVKSTLDALKVTLERVLVPEVVTSHETYHKSLLWVEPSFQRRVRLELLGVYSWAMLLLKSGRLHDFVALTLPIVDMWKNELGLFAVARDVVITGDVDEAKRRGHIERPGLAVICPQWLVLEQIDLFTLSASLCVGCWAIAAKGPVNKYLESTITLKVLEDLIILVANSLWFLHRPQLARFLASLLSPSFSRNDPLLNFLPQGLLVCLAEARSPVSSEDQSISTSGAQKTLALLHAILHRNASGTDEAEKQATGRGHGPTLLFTSSGNVTLNTQCEEFASNPESVELGNKLFRILFKLKSAANYDDSMPDIGELLDLPLLLGAHPRSTPLALFASMDSFGEKKNLQCLNRLLDAFENTRDDPVLLLCIALQLLAVATHHNDTSKNKEYFLAALASLNQYATIRLSCKIESQSDNLELGASMAARLKQEVLFNIGKFYDIMDLKFVAESFYRKVLDVDPNWASSPTSHLLLVRKSAFNLIQIYKSSNSRDRATEIMLKYLDFSAA